MENQKRYSLIENISIAGGSISFDVTANDTFDVTEIHYNTSSRYSKVLKDIDVTSSFTPTQSGDMNRGTVSICLEPGEGCTVYPEIFQPFDGVLNMFTVITSETLEENCLDCDHDVHLIFDYVGELRKLSDKIIGQYSSCECIDVTKCDLEKAFLLELLNVIDQTNTVTESVEFYNGYKDLCCD